MPKSHRANLEWTPSRFLNWAQDIGPHTCQLVKHLLTSRPHPEMGFRSCLGLLSLEKRYGKRRLENACQRAIDLGALTRGSVLSILEKGIDLLPPYDSSQDSSLPDHENIRGPQYYS